MTSLHDPIVASSQQVAVEDLAHHQVLQRQSPDGAAVSVPAGPIELRGPHGLPLGAAVDGTLWLPTGGPYEIVRVDGDDVEVLVTDVLVGDLWVLAGQSNMEGCGRMARREAAGPVVRVLDMRGHWRFAEEPLHMKWLPGTHQVHDRLEKERQAANADKPADPVRYHLDQLDPDEQPVNGFLLGVGPGVAFANELTRRTGVPIGLLPTAHGGSSMAEWDPAAGDGLFDALLTSVIQSGGRITGVLWYQGESESDPSAPYSYDEQLAALFEAFRERTGRSDLTVLAVQLGRFVIPRNAEMDLRWSRLRESQRTCPEADGVVSAVDLDLDDPIHLGAAGLVRLGRRLARLADGGPSLRLADVTVERDGFVIDVRFDGVVGELQGGHVPQGFTVRDAAGNDQQIVFRVDLLGDRARVRLSRAVKAGERLWYGYGLDPSCTLVDGEDMGVPAFGPVALGLG